MSTSLIISYLPTGAELRAMWPMWIVAFAFAALYFWSLHKEHVEKQLARMKGKSDRKLERQMREAIAASEQPFVAEYPVTGKYGTMHDLGDGRYDWVPNKPA